MIISRTPLRISFSGGGSDLKEYYMKYGGCVISTSIDKYVYLSMHPYFYTNKFLLKYSDTEKVDNIKDIKHPIIREVFKEYKIHGVDFNSNADIPAGGTGLGSSSAFTSGLITLCNAYNGLYLPNNKVASLACDIEINRLKEPIGKQDQYACAMGGLNFISFNSDDTVDIEKIRLTNEKGKQLQRRLLMFYTGITRSTKSILSVQRKNILTSNKKIMNLHKMVSLTKILKDELNKGELGCFGDILHEGWMHKKEMADSISNPAIDDIYRLAMKNGAEGGKILGAGGGGFFLFYVKEENQEKLIKGMKNFRCFDFNFETVGSTIIYCN